MSARTYRVAPTITPGPWQSDATGTHYQGHVIRSTGMVICRMLDLGFPSHGDREANARLIAKAPELADLLAQVACSEVAALDIGVEGNFCGICEAALHYNNETEQTEGHESDCLTVRARALLAEINGPKEGEKPSC